MFPSTRKISCYSEWSGRETSSLIRCSHLDCGQCDRFVAKVREAMSLAGLNYDNYSGHSFRIGAAMTAAQKGISDSTIKMLGRWKSSAYALYIKTPRDHLARFSATLVSEDKYEYYLIFVV